MGGVADLAEAVFKKCMEGSDPLFGEGWSGRSEANQDGVLSWFAGLSEKLVAFAEDYKPAPTHRRRPLAQPNRPIQGSTEERKMDNGFVSDLNARRDSRWRWPWPHRVVGVEV